MHIKNAREGLKIRGQTIDNLMFKLFKDYNATSDSKFVEYIEKKEDAYIDGEDMIEEQFIQLTLNK